MKFTDRYLQSIKPPEKEYCIREGHGFTLRVLPSGVKTFQYIYSLNGKRQRLNLGQYPAVSLAEAREKFRQAALLVGKGINPQAPPVATEAAKPFTISDLVDLYKKFTEQHLAASTSRETARTLDKYVVPVWGNRAVPDIRRRDAIDLIDPIAAETPGQARGVMKIARAMFNYALERELADFNPFTRLPTAVPSIKPVSTSRTLSDAEIKHVWNLLHSANAPGTPETRRALLLVLVTAQRPGEVAGMAWDEIDEKWWTIPPERIKTRNHRKESHRVFLTPLALRLIGINPNYSGYVFPGPPKPPPTPETPPIDTPLRRHALSHMVCDEREGGRFAGDGNKTEAMAEYFGLPRWTPHDLRRTAATKLSELGCPDEIIDAILNHAKQGVIGVYNRNKYDKEKTEWLTVWTDHLEKLVRGEVDQAVRKQGWEGLGIELRVVSDLHMEFADFFLPAIKGDHNRILVLAGDIGLARQSQTYLPFLKTVAGQFRQVLWVLGNHEHYGDSIIKSREHIEFELAEAGLSNVRILENEAFTVDNVTFLGATLWTDVRDNDPPTIKATLGSMDDYFEIRCGTDSAPFVRNLSADDTISIHRESRSWLLREAKRQKEAGRKLVVVTHHLPTYESVQNQPGSGRMSPGFATKMDSELAAMSADLWIHGHVHVSCDYLSESGTRIVCNPRGYDGVSSNVNFEPRLIVR